MDIQLLGLIAGIINIILYIIVFLNKLSTITKHLTNSILLGIILVLYTFKAYTDFIYLEIFGLLLTIINSIAILFTVFNLYHSLKLYKHGKQNIR